MHSVNAATLDDDQAACMHACLRDFNNTILGAAVGKQQQLHPSGAQRTQLLALASSCRKHDG